MKHIGWILAALLISGIVTIAAAQCPMCPNPACPQPGAGFRNGPGPGMGMKMGPRHEMMRGRMMENGERETIRGRVVSITQAERGPALRVMVESDSRVVPVMIGPMMPLDQLSEPLERGDRIEVRGVRVERMGQPALIARMLRLDESGETIHVQPRPHDGPPMMGDRQPFMGDRPPRMDRPMHRGPWRKRVI